VSATLPQSDAARPPDEMGDQHHPLCETCASAMWLTQVVSKVSSKGIEARKTYECKNCGSVQWHREQRTDPLPTLP
jgi:hypothetical protein